MTSRPMSTLPGRWLLPALTTIALAGPVRAQAQAQAHPGDLVRVQLAHNAPMRTGRLVALDPDSIVLALPESEVVLPIPRAAVARAWVSTGRSRSTGRGLLVGLTAGAVAGAALGAIAYEPCESQEFMGCLLDLGRGGTALLVGAAGGTLGLVVGGVAGFATVREKWEPLELPARVAVNPDGDGGVALTIRLPL